MYRFIDSVYDVDNDEGKHNRIQIKVLTTLPLKFQVFYGRSSIEKIKDSCFL